MTTETAGQLYNEGDLPAEVQGLVECVFNCLDEPDEEIYCVGWLHYPPPEGLPDDGLYFSHLYPFGSYDVESHNPFDYFLDKLNASVDPKGLDHREPGTPVTARVIGDDWTPAQRAAIYAVLAKAGIPLNERDWRVALA